MTFFGSCVKAQNRDFFDVAILASISVLKIILFYYKLYIVGISMNRRFQNGCFCLIKSYFQDFRRKFTLALYFRPIFNWYLVPVKEVSGFDVYCDHDD